MAANAPFFHITLKEEDVPGAKLPYSSVEKHSNSQLRRWLQCRELKSSGNKEELVKRVQQCIEAKKDKIIPVSVDNGKWYNIKLEGVKKLEANNEKCSVPPITGWDSFPSVNLPKHFNKGHIHHHIVESVQFVQRPGCSGNGSDTDSDPDIEDLSTNKPMKRGKEFLKSNYILDLKDCQRNASYFLKATVWASYSNDDYKVMVEISQDSGFVRDASCTCTANAMGRCSHVAGLLYKLEEHLLKHGPEPMTCTSKKSYWGQGKKKRKNPTTVTETQYPSSKKKKVDDIITYDPTPNFPERNPASTLNDFLTCVESNSATTTMWDTLLFRTYDDYKLDENQLVVLDKKVQQFQQNLSLMSDVITEAVDEQGTQQWHAQRRVRVTASIAKSVSTANTAQTVSGILKSKLWVENKQTKGMLYGTENESRAFDDYQKNFPNSVLNKTGLWINPAFPQIGASPDGVIADSAEDDDGLLEIKCPFILQDKLVQNFETVLTKQQLKNFCLQRKDGQIMLKPSHAYFYQIQTQLAVLNKKWCDLMIWGGENNFQIIRVRFEQDFWNELREKLVSFHKHWLSPEYFEMRIPRRLLPIKV